MLGEFEPLKAIFFKLKAWPALTFPFVLIVWPWTVHPYYAEAYKLVALIASYILFTCVRVIPAIQKHTRADAKTLKLCAASFIFSLMVIFSYQGTIEDLTVSDYKENKGGEVLEVDLYFPLFYNQDLTDTLEKIGGKERWMEVELSHSDYEREVWENNHWNIVITNFIMLVWFCAGAAIFCVSSMIAIHRMTMRLGDE